MHPWPVSGLFGLCFLVITCTVKGQFVPPSFQPGVLHQYHYTLDLQLEHVSQPAMPKGSLKADAAVHAHLLWRNSSHPDEQLVQVQIHDFQVLHLPEGTKSVNSSEGLSPVDLVGKENIAQLTLPVIFRWNSGKVVDFYGILEGNSQILDLKRGLVSLFQLRMHSGNERDVSGMCQVTYNVSEDFITKMKDLRSCTGSTQGHTSVNKMFGVQWQPTSKSVYSLKGSLIQTVVAEEEHDISLTIKSSISTRITSRQKLNLVSTLPGPAEALGLNVEEVVAKLPEKYHVIELMGQPLKNTCPQCPSLITYLKKSGRRPMRINQSKPLATRRFHMFVQMLRYAKKKDVLQLLEQSSGDMVHFLIDAAVAAQSVASLAAVSDFLDFNKKNQVSLQERFLHAAAFAPRPSVQLLGIIMDKLKGPVSDPTVMTTGLIVTGAVVGKLCQMNLCEEEELEYAKATLVEGLKAAEDEPEEIIYLLSLKNAQLPETIPLLLEYAEEHTGAVSSTALAALQSFPSKHINDEVKKTLRRIFHQNRESYEKTSRLTAAEILLTADPSLFDFTNILLALEAMDIETAKLLLSKIQNILHSQQSARKVIQQVLKEPQLNNYHRLSRLGGSSSFSGLMTASKDLVSTYSLELLNTESGLLRRSLSDFLLLSHGHPLQAAQVSIEASGLESILGTGTDEEKEGDEEQEVMAGMSAILFGVQLRPIVFFKGYMDLVSKIFANGGEPINIVQGNVLLIDHLQGIPLQSGLQGIVEFQGGLGLDIFANVDVSLWDQDSKTSIKTKSGLVIDLKAEINSPFYQAQMRARTEAETSLNFNTVVKFFGAPVQVCLQLFQDKLPYKEVFTVMESFPKLNVSSKVCKGRNGTIPGREFPLHRANSEMCKILLYEEPQPQQPTAFEDGGQMLHGEL
ncbi:microsomal triglyceride transfer protein large subunit-like isoform X2 [Ambystoma mexicanum]|uniref:microsomal triglyceride transfer protein large subunit-like isoform X2 n=1 Tax=Ambystoma mexicanum TaxID=8296 RepID=UPI0037E72671